MIDMDLTNLAEKVPAHVAQKLRSLIERNATIEEMREWARTLDDESLNAICEILDWTKFRRENR